MNLTRRAFTLGASALAAAPGLASTPPALKTGVDRLLGGEGYDSHGRRVALLTHAGARDAFGRRSVDALAEFDGFELVALLSPEHGLGGTAAAGETVADGRDAATGLPVYSLYGTHRQPPDELLGRIDTILIDLQDVGVRPYTYAATMIDTIRTATARGVGVLVLDRPNPLGGLAVDGPFVAPGLASPVSALRTPFRHGLTLGELAFQIEHNERRDLDVAILPVRGWDRTMGVAALAPWGRDFAPPSPNLRTPGAILAYAATVLVEGTNLSEGRGTETPFQTIGAPWCKGVELAGALTALELPGVQFAPIEFTPSSSKHAGSPCSGVSFEVDDEAAYNPLLIGLSLIAEARRRHPETFAFLPGERPFFDLLIGQSWVREALLAGDAPAAIVARWQDDATAFATERQEYLLYQELQFPRSP